MSEQLVQSPLDKRFPVPGKFGLVFAAIAITAFLLRFLHLDGYLLNHRESRWAYESWSLFYGRPMPAGEDLPSTAPFMLLWNTVGYFLFGVTDATARIGSAVLGMGMVAMTLWLRPVLTRSQILCVAGILAISPTVVFASRNVEPGILAAFLAYLLVIALVRARHNGELHGIWIAAIGFAAAGLYATGPVGVTALVTLVVGFVVVVAMNRENPVADTIAAICRDRRSLAIVIGSVVSTLVLLFTRLLTTLSGLGGLGTTVSEWATMLTDGSATISTTFFAWSLLLYEAPAVIIVVVAGLIAVKGRDQSKSVSGLPVGLLAGWFVVSLIVFSSAASRNTGSAILVALPLLITAGILLGSVLDQQISTRSISLIMGYVLLAGLLIFGVNSSIGLSFRHGESGREPLAIDTPSSDASEFIDQSLRLSHDLSASEPNRTDPTGRFGLTIKVTPEHEWPFTWYFRDFYEFEVTPPGGFTSDTDIAIGSDSAGMDNVALTPSTRTWIVQPNDPLTELNSSAVMKTIVNPANWGDAWNFFMRRQAPESNGENREITVGHSSRAINKLTTNTGPFNLFDTSSPGVGGGLGQLNAPTGIAVASDGSIMVLNAGNARIDRYGPDGTFTNVWTGQIDPALQLSWNGFQGGNSISTSPDGLFYIADTWNHAVIVVNADGKVVQILGNRGSATDITDAGAPTDQPGLFFGPRDVAVSDTHIYVTDTGNERVQVFTTDGTFVKAFGGFGTGDGQFVEPTGLAIAPDGSVWVADSGNARIQVFDSEGTWIASHHIQEWETQQGVDRLNDLAFAPDGTLYFTVQNLGVFSLVDDRTLQVSEVLRPGGIAFDNDGNVLVTDTTNANVLRIQLPDSTDTGTPTASPAATPAD